MMSGFIATRATSVEAMSIAFHPLRPEWPSGDRMRYLIVSAARARIRHLTATFPTRSSPTSKTGPASIDYRRDEEYADVLLQMSVIATSPGAHRQSDGIALWMLMVKSIVRVLEIVVSTDGEYDRFPRTWAKLLDTARLWRTILPSWEWHHADEIVNGLTCCELIQMRADHRLPLGSAEYTSPSTSPSPSPACDVLCHLCSRHDALQHVQSSIPVLDMCFAIRQRIFSVLVGIRIQRIMCFNTVSDHKGTPTSVRSDTLQEEEMVTFSRSMKLLMLTDGLRAGDVEAEARRQTSCPSELLALATPSGYAEGGDDDGATVACPEEQKHLTKKRRAEESDDDGDTLLFDRCTASVTNVDVCRYPMDLSCE